MVWSHQQRVDAELDDTLEHERALGRKVGSPQAPVETVEGPATPSVDALLASDLEALDDHHEELVRETLEDARLPSPREAYRPRGRSRLCQ